MPIYLPQVSCKPPVSKWPHSEWYCFIQTTNIVPWIPCNCVWFSYNWTILVSIWGMNFSVIDNQMTFFFHSSAKRKKKKNNYLDCCQVGPRTGTVGLRGNLWVPRKSRECVRDYRVRQVKTGMDQPPDEWRNSASLFR